MQTTKVVTHTLNFKNTNITLETGLLARQATSSVLAKMGETTVLAAVVIGKETQADYFPLQVIYEERMYASGKIKGSRFIKREGRPSENAILVGRMIDRSLRSLFDKNTRSEVQVVITVLSIDEVNPPDVLSVLAASTALKLATDDFMGPVSSVRVGQIAQSGLKSLINKLIAKIPLISQFEEISDELSDLCGIIELGDEQQKIEFKTIFDLLLDRNPEWATKLKEVYQGSNRSRRDLLLNKYPQSNETVVMPSYEQLQDSILDLVISGDDKNIMMVEAGSNIIVETDFDGYFDLAMQNLATLTQFQQEFISKAREQAEKEPAKLIIKKPDTKFINYWSDYYAELENALFTGQFKEQRAEDLENFKKLHFQTIKDLQDLAENLKTDHREDFKVKLNSLVVINNHLQKDIATNILSLADSYKELLGLETQLKLALDNMIHQVVQDNVLQKNRRLDGRRLDETRQIIAKTGILPRTHGSSLFQRGETQVLNILTLGTSRDAQLLDDMEDFEEQTKRYIHHYNFPAYSVGETGRYIGPGRREIGHGALAEKALLPVLPSEDEFPYTIRLVSECLGSNGSTSMASTCASSLSLYEAGVPIKDMVAGVAMGLILNESSGEFKVLTDIQGSEDHYGDMDFKITGTKDGITAIQLDNKVFGLTADILKQALRQAKEARMHILNIMMAEIDKPKPEISRYAPGVAVMQVPFEKIGEVIGPSGKVIKGIIAKYGVDIDIEDATGKTFIYSKDRDNVKLAAEYIQKLIKEYLPGEVVTGKVFRIESYGAFIKIDDTDKEGMIHISQISSKRVNNINEVIKMGQEVTAKIVEVNDKGQLSLSMKFQ